MSSPAVIVVTAIGNDIAFDEQGWIFRVSQELDTPDKYVTVFDYSGDGRLVTLGDGSDDVLRPAVQIRIRGAKNIYADTYNFCEYVEAYMRKFSYMNGSDKYAFASQTGGINFLKYDDSARPIFTLNFTLYKCTV